MIIKGILFFFAIFFFIRMKQERKKAIEISKKFAVIKDEKSKLSNSIREKGITIDRLERMNKDLQKELENK